MASDYIQIPAPGSASWKAPVATVAALPASGNNIGDARVTRDTSGIYVWSGSAWVAEGGGGGVTSVGLTAPASVLSVSGSPVTTSGTLALSLATQAANKVWAGPTTGADTTPTFRSLVSADLPAGVGTVTSVAMTVPSGLAVGGSPITGAGTFAITASGQFVASQMPAFTGDVTTSAGAVATTIANNAVTNAKAAQMAANTIKGNNTGSTANASDLTVAQAQALLNPATQAKAALFTAVCGITYILTGSNYAITLPDATVATNTAPITFVVQSSPNEASGPITFTFVSAQTCDGFATYSLYTKYERLTIVSDGSNWQVVSHSTTMPQSTGLSVTPVGFGTISGLTTHYERQGTKVHLWGEFTCGTGTGVTLAFTLPSALTIDSTAYSSSTLLIGWANPKTTAQTTIDGSAAQMEPYYDGSTTGTLQLGYYTSANAFLGGLGNGGFIINAKPYYFDATFHVSGWRP